MPRLPTIIANVAITAVAVPMGYGLHRISRWIERRTGNDPLAFLIVFSALGIATTITAVVAVGKH